jgi:hypothetical protein
VVEVGGGPADVSRPVADDHRQFLEGRAEDEEALIGHELEDVVDGADGIEPHLVGGVGEEVEDEDHILVEPFLVAVVFLVELVDDVAHALEDLDDGGLLGDGDGVVVADDLLATFEDAVVVLFLFEQISEIRFKFR